MTKQTQFTIAITVTEDQLNLLIQALSISANQALENAAVGLEDESHRAENAKSDHDRRRRVLQRIIDKAREALIMESRAREMREQLRHETG